MATARTPAAYVAALEPERRREFAKLRAFVRKNLPKARETMSYKMPTYELAGQRVCAIAAQKRYLALYLCESRALDRQRRDFSHLDVGVGCIRFRSTSELPLAASRTLLGVAASLTAGEADA